MNNQTSTKPTKTRRNIYRNDVTAISSQVVSTKWLQLSSHRASNSSEELGTMSKNNLWRITLGRGPIWGIHSLTLIISCYWIVTFPRAKDPASTKLDTILRKAGRWLAGPRLIHFRFTLSLYPGSNVQTVSRAWLLSKKKR